ncbi:putative RING-H2 finger protein ATL19 [Manihot esculenta]|uniref:Uncharacterized protein n=2 Tax=Manihot esculenta TaxID=3983 RepID=A0ACB7GCN2_MANES|nr:putative RING-H2 finger protein ATL19 [Manihot esculenta]KAG8638002.1 hypothetical protein MANES_15G181700v8 [Manihot esculenta]
MESSSLHSLFQLILAFVLIGAFLVVVALLFYEVFQWRQAIDNHNRSNLEAQMDILESQSSEHIEEIFLRLPEELAGVYLEEQQKERHQREQTIRNLPPPLDYDTYKTTTSITECAICLDEFGSGDLCRLLPLCKHIYHFECINQWLLEELTCPICRSPIVNP